MQDIKDASIGNYTYNRFMKHRLSQYLNRTKVGRLDFIRQLLFVIFTPLAIVLFSLHLLGCYGLTILSAQICSACYILTSAIALLIYLWKGPKVLKQLLSIYLVAVASIQSVRLVILASMGQQPPMLTTINLTACCIIVFIGCMAMLPRATFICTAISIAAMVICGCVTHAQMYWQLLIVFGVAELTTTAFCIVSTKLFNDEYNEKQGYVNTIDQILHVFNISKTELLTLLQLAKAQDTRTIYDEELVDRLSPKTVRNIIHAANQIEHIQSERRQATLERYPMLTPAELDVCRLVERGMTLKEIANALGKSTSNVSTVRGNIRKKLGLSQNDDLRTYLLSHDQ